MLRNHTDFTLPPDLGWAQSTHSLPQSLMSVTNRASSLLTSPSTITLRPLRSDPPDKNTLTLRVTPSCRLIWGVNRLSDKPAHTLETGYFCGEKGGHAFANTANGAQIIAKIEIEADDNASPYLWSVDHAIGYTTLAPTIKPTLTPSRSLSLQIECDTQAKALLGIRLTAAPTSHTITL